MAQDILIRKNGSEMKPVGYISETAMNLLSFGGYASVNLRAKERSSSFQSPWNVDIPLYTAKQLAEAVAAESERCAKVCEELGGTGQSGYLSTSYDPENRGADCAEDMAERIAEAIRSAAK